MKSNSSRYLCGLVAGLLSLTVAAAQAANPYSGTGTSRSGDLPNAVDATYMIDDGTAEDSIGLTAGGSFISLNSFQVTGGLNMITDIQIAWGTPAFPDPSLNGLPYVAYLWSGTGPSPSSGTTLLGSVPGVISSAGTDTFLTSTFATPINVGANGAWFFVGFAVTHSAGQFPAAFDETSPISNRSYINLGGDPNNLSGAAPIESFGLVGNWLIRADATAIPEPSSWAMIGLGAALLIGFMRFRARLS